MLQPGDILVRVNGRYVTQFEPLEEVLDASVGGTVELELERGGKPVSREAAGRRPARHHARAPMPSSATRWCNTLSYQQARHFNVPVRGVYVANPGYVFGAAGIPRGAVITDAERASRSTRWRTSRPASHELGDGDRATVRYFTIDDPNGSQLRSFRMDRRWFPAHHCDRDDTPGLWHCKDLRRRAGAEAARR